MKKLGKELYPIFRDKFGTELGTKITREQWFEFCADVGECSKDDHIIVQQKAATNVRRKLQFFMTRQLGLSRWFTTNNGISIINEAPTRAELVKKQFNQLHNWAKTRDQRNSNGLNLAGDITPEMGKQYLRMSIETYDKIVIDNHQLIKENEQLKSEFIKMQAERDYYRGILRDAAKRVKLEKPSLRVVPAKKAVE